MSMVQKIEIDGKQVAFKASAAIPRIYRIKFQRDIYKDLAALEKAISKEDETVSNLDMFSLEMFENIAYVMAFLIHRKSGWMRLIPFRFTRCFRRSSSCGD